MNFMQKCLLQQIVEVDMAEYYDHRYFFVESDIGNYVCGLARETMAPILFKHRSRFFLDPEWINAISKSGRNPSMLGFLVEQSCLAEISCSGLRVGDVNLQPDKTYFFEGFPDYDLAIGVTLYISLKFNFKAIDGLLLKIFTEKVTQEVPVLTKSGKPSTSKGKPRTKKTIVEKKCAHLIPIQITLSKDHSDSVKKFFDDLHEYSENLRDYNRIDYSFLWIKEGVSKTEAKHSQNSYTPRGGQVLIHPEFTEHTIPIDHISTQIKNALDEARGAST